MTWDEAKATLPWHTWYAEYLAGCQQREENLFAWRLFDWEDRELAYVLPTFDVFNVHVFDTPRVWSSEFKTDLVFVAERGRPLSGGKHGRVH